MFGPCPVVRIKYDNEDGFCEINESDFDSGKHELFDEGAKKATVASLRDELTEKGIEIPEGAKKADLLALLANA